VDELLARSQRLDVSGATRRRSGTDAAFATALSDIRAELAEIRRFLTDEAGREEDTSEGDDAVRRARTDLSLELASLLFSAGAPHAEWRWWASQAAEAFLADGDAESAAVWALVAHDDGVVRRLPRAPAPGTRPGRVVWWLASAPVSESSGGIRSGGSPSLPRDDVDAAWVVLTRSIPEADHRSTGRALRTITDFWMAEDEDWENFHPHYYPDFEPELNAVAVLARRSGWKPTGWPPVALRFLEPGLAAGAPS
jgi:hypothetical protein